jgi:hypothetical protein
MTFTLVQAIPYAIAIFMLGFFFGIIAKVFKCEKKRTTDDYIDWSKIPDGRDWVAIDGEQVWAGSLVRCYSMEPRISTMGNYHIDDSADEDTPVPSEAIIGPLPPWRESTRRRQT